MRYPYQKYTALLLPFIFTSTAFAEYEAYPEGYFQLRGGAGMGWLSADDAELDTSEGETDNVEFDDGDGVVATFGVGYVFPLTQEYDDLRWFPAAVASIDGAYQFETDFSGDVKGNGDLDQDNDQNTTNIETLNVMFNITAPIVEYQRWTFFVIGGMGSAWTWVDYEDSRIELDRETNTTFAYQGGAGVGFELMPELDLNLTYLYTNLGSVNTSSDHKHDADDEDIDITAAEFELSQQSLILGLTWNFI
jgi:opacity protein-like surface antigen